MSKRIIGIFICCFVLLSAPVWAETEGFKVAGKVSFTKTGDIYIELVTKAQFEGEEASSFGLIIPVGPEEQKAKKVSFEFENVPAGTYAIQCFQDINGNGGLDMGNFGPKEPWGMYRPKRHKFRGPRFNEIKFDVKKDMTDIQFEVK
jgi:uncharacterized protein (DUF2141 family)